MSHSDEAAGRVVPAQLNFLAIYNPELGAENNHAAREQDQIVFFYSQSAGDRHKRHTKSVDGSKDSNDAVNEQLRQVGLAQGMVAFARDFSNGAPVDSVETERHRIVLKQLETGWWILASIDLTRRPKAKAASNQTDKSALFDYSAREVSPPVLLLQQLQCAHRIFLLHHGKSLSDLFARLTRDRFCSLLDRFWTKFSLTWDVLLHGNPSVDVYGGIKLAAGGELGIGVGEEDWGSAERDILEGLVRNADGLVDLTVSRFGEAVDESKQKTQLPNSHRDQKDKANDDFAQHWIGQGLDPGPADGIIFSGLGKLTPPSLRALTDWVTWIYMYGNDAYGIQDDPNSSRRRRKKRKPVNVEQGPSDLREPKSQPKATQDQKSSQNESDRGGRPPIPPPIVSAEEESLKEANSSATKSETENRNNTIANAHTASSTASTNSEQWVKYLTLGYGSVWGPVSKTAQNDTAKSQSDPTVSLPSQADKVASKPTGKTSGALSGESKKLKPTNTNKVTKSQASGFFLLGLQGDLDAEDEPHFREDSGTDLAENDEAGPSRISLRTVHIELNSTRLPGQDAKEEPQETEAPTSRLRVVVYVHPPFVYTLLYDASCVSISIPSCFHDLHHHLTPLHGPLLKSTSPATVSSRLQSTLPNPASPIYDLVHSARSLATHCSIPNIPLAGTLAAEGLPHTPGAPTWTRREALNVHSQILSTYADTRRRAGERERTAKTGRGWWVVWMRVPTTSSDTAAASQDDPDTAEHSEAVLVRKASDHLQPRGGWMGGASVGAGAGRRTTFGGAGAFGRLVGGRDNSGGGSGGVDASGAGGAGSSGRLAEGIGLGVDPRRYVEVLLSLCR